MRYLLFFVALFFATSVYTQSKLEKIEAVLQLSHGFNSDLIVEPLKKAYTDPRADSTFWAEIGQEFVQEMIKIYIPIYDKYFTENEIDGLLTFYRSPLGQKFIQNTALIAQENMDAMMTFSSTMMSRIQEKLKE